MESTNEIKLNAILLSMLSSILHKNSIEKKEKHLFRISSHTKYSSLFLINQYYRFALSLGTFRKSKLTHGIPMNCPFTNRVCSNV